MRIAITYEDGKIFQHFGHTEYLKVYEIENGKIVTASIVDTKGDGHGALADFLKGENVDTLICGGIGDGAKRALAKADIMLYGGVAGDADQAAADFLEDKLNYNPDVACNHHDGEHNCGH